jgi:hypothetical protein
MPREDLSFWIVDTNLRSQRVLQQLGRRTWQFEGLAISKGQHVYLSAWGEPRRMNISEALRKVLANAGQEGVTIQEGMVRMTDLLGRPFPPNLFFGQISWHVGAVYDETTKRWRLSAEGEIERQEA